jgi:opacity protein-like surface antigen
MKRTLFLLALIVLGAVPVLAQESNEFGVLLGGSRRFVEGGGDVRSITGDAESDWIESNFSFSNTSIELYWSIPIEPDLSLKFQGGRLETQIPVSYMADDPDTAEVDPVQFRKDVADGEVSHIETLIQYEFDEPFGSSGLFAGLGYYRLSAPGEESQSTWGVTAGVNADFPITRRYGAVLEAAYHWTHAEFQPRFLTVGGGLRVSF